MVVQRRVGRAIEICEVGRRALRPPVRQPCPLVLIDIPIELGDVGLLLGDRVARPVCARIIAE